MLNKYILNNKGLTIHEPAIKHYIKSNRILKDESSLMIFDKHANLKYRYGNREFWCRGYYVDTVGKNKKAIAEYIRNQLQEDLAYEQMSIKELVDPFTGEPVKASKK